MGCRDGLGQPHIQEREYRETSLGQALYIRIFTDNYRQLSWSEVWAVFSQRYPGRWACQFFPPADCVLDEENIYHLFVLEEDPRNVDVNFRRLNHAGRT